MNKVQTEFVTKIFDLSGRVAIVTGGAGLLGYHHGSILAAAGAHVVLLDLAAAAPDVRATQLIEAHGVECIGMAADITSEASLIQVRDYLLSRFGRIDILINNAANNPKVEDTQGQAWSRLENFPLAVWDADIRVGLTGHSCAAASSAL
jgi:NAD(P)-dependent dehydrogenase (short-subunit alcohol dehydrogenase family)